MNSKGITPTITLPLARRRGIATGILAGIFNALAEKKVPSPVLPRKEGKVRMGALGADAYSHSMVPGGLLVMS